MRRKLLASVIAVFFSLFLIEAHAATQKSSLKGEKDFKSARGDIVISDAGPGQRQISVNATGLKPNATYTLWFVNEEPRMDMAGVGTGDYSFRTDAQGNGRYTATVSEDDLRKWELFEIAYHPDNNPRNMEDIQIALKGDVPETAG